MKELSLHILDIGQNSVSAGASLIVISISEKTVEDFLAITIEDNGCGMDAETVKKVTDPFYTSRTTRKVGLGIPMFKANAELSNGKFELESELGKGTVLTAVFQRSHIDRVPLGDMADTIMAMVMANPDGDLIYRHNLDDREFVMDTQEMRAALGDVPLDDVQVLLWVKGYVAEGLEEIGVKADAV